MQELVWDGRGKKVSEFAESQSQAKPCASVTKRQPLSKSFLWPLCSVRHMDHTGEMTRKFQLRRAMYGKTVLVESDWNGILFSQSGPS